MQLRWDNDDVVGGEKGSLGLPVSLTVGIDWGE